MAAEALALPICNLTLLVVEAKEETKSAIQLSRTRAIPDIVSEVQKTGQHLSHVVEEQAKLIELLTSFDFAPVDLTEISKLAGGIEGLVANEAELVNSTNVLHPKICALWHTPLAQLVSQMDHLDSIAESLRMECDSDVTFLIALAAAEVLQVPACFSARS